MLFLRSAALQSGIQQDLSICKSRIFSVTVGGGNTVTLATLSGIGTTASNFRSAKVLVLAEASDGRIEYDELNLIHDGTEVELLEYGQLSIHSQDAYSAIGMGTYGVYLSGSDVVLSYDQNQHYNNHNQYYG